MEELLATETDYIKDLDTCINVYLKSYRMKMNLPSTPEAIQNKEREIFGNVEAVFEFHSRDFLKQLRCCQSNPEDVALSFMLHTTNLKELYTVYCLNKAENGDVVNSAEANALFNVSPLLLCMPPSRRSAWSTDCRTVWTSTRC